MVTRNIEISAGFRRISAHCLFVGTLLSLLLLQGCFGFGRISYFRPSGDGFLFSFGDPACFAVRDAIRLQIEDGAVIELHAERGVFTGNKWLDKPGTTLLARVHVPAGVQARFVANAFRASTPTGDEFDGPISEITRRFLYGRNNMDSRMEWANQSLTSNQTLIGWTPEDARASGIMPPAPWISEDLLNKFEFVVQIEGLVANSFSVIVPEMVVNNRLVSSKSVAFTIESEMAYGWVCP